MVARLDLTLPGFLTPPNQPIATRDCPRPEDALPGSSRLANPRTLLPGFDTNLFVQAKLSEAKTVAELTRHVQVGVVLTLEHKGYQSQVQSMFDAVQILRSQGAVRDDILIDRNLYSGPTAKGATLFGGPLKRKVASDGLSRLWINDQLQRASLKMALTDSGYCPTLHDVRQVLADAATFPVGTLTLLPVPFTLVRDEAAALVELINGHPHPVAFVLEHEADPFDEGGVAAGCVHVIHGCIQAPVFLRTDTSALGLIAHGAAAAAVGTHSSLRHLYPPKDSGKAIPEKLAFVIPDLMGFYTQNRFVAAYLADSTQPAWRCACWFCAGRDLIWIGSQAKKLQMPAAFQHSVAAVADLGHQLQRQLAVGVEGATAWDEMCGVAQAAHDAISNPSGSSWQPKIALKQWRSLPRTRSVS